MKHSRTKAPRIVPPPSFPLHYLGPLRSRPRLASAIGVGLLVALLLAVLPFRLDRSTRATLAWDLGCVWFIALVLQECRDRDAPYIRGVAAAQDEGQGLILTLVLVAAAASLGAVAVELSGAKDVQGLIKGIRVVLAFCTVALSWFVVQLIFALHYAHEYYAPDRDDDPTTHEQGGLQFPGDTLPDYWDFLHFAVVIGAASQTADIAFTSRRMRRIGTVHSLVAFTFNTAILALTINLLAGLF